MDVRLDPEQLALRESAARLVDRLGPGAVGQLDDLERAEKLDAAVAAAGWRELRTATDDGSPLASGVEVGLVGEELARGLADTAYLGPTLAAELRRLAGAPAAPTPETVALGPDLADVVVVESGSHPADATVLDARGARTALVLVPTDDGAALGQVDVADGDAPVDLTRATARVAAGAPVVPVADCRPLAADDHARWLALGLAMTSADLVGIMAGAVRLACDYAAERRQFGTAVGSFQAVQHLLADALVATEGARSATLHAAWAVDALAPDDALAAGAVAKAYASRAALGACETSIQVHGGIGNTWECLAHVHLRRALLSIEAFGGAGPSVDRVLAHHGIGGADGLR
jgi:hypothetical protein